jgi:hypothetical protein
VICSAFVGPESDAIAALRFFFILTLGRPDVDFH